MSSGGGRDRLYPLRGGTEARPCADDVERRTAHAGVLAGRRDELAALDPGDCPGQLRLEQVHVLDAEGRRDDRVGTLEEVVDDLDLRRAGAEAGERVDEPLQPVVACDDLLRSELAEGV